MRLLATSEKKTIFDAPLCWIINLFYLAFSRPYLLVRLPDLFWHLFKLSLGTYTDSFEFTNVFTFGAIPTWKIKMAGGSGATSTRCSSSKDNDVIEVPASEKR